MTSFATRRRSSNFCDSGILGLRVLLDILVILAVRESDRSIALGGRNSCRRPTPFPVPHSRGSRRPPGHGFRGLLGVRFYAVTTPTKETGPELAFLEVERRLGGYRLGRTFDSLDSPNGVSGRLPKMAARGRRRAVDAWQLEILSRTRPRFFGF